MPLSALTQPYPPTLLSLGRYGRIMGLNPMHFMSGDTPGLNPMVMPVGGCDDVWFKYDWQDNDKVSLYQLAQLIHDAEQEIANIIGFYPAPYWIEDEIHPYPRHYMRDVRGFGYDLRGKSKELAAGYGKFILPGERAVTLVSTATVAGASLVYSDEDSDGYYETATINLATTLTDVNEIKVYHTDADGAIEWEIRPVRSKSITAGVVTIVADSWYFINPELYEAYHTDPQGLDPIDVSTTSNFVTSVEVYREYADLTGTSAVFFWEPDQPRLLTVACPVCGTIGCITCAYDTQNGCMIARNHNTGTVVVSPATYDEDSAAWAAANWLYCYEPDIVKIHYLSGDQSQEWLQGRSIDPLSQFWAQTIAWLATARLERPLCSCGNAYNLAEELRTDLTQFGGGITRFVTNDVMTSPFGTRKGEVMAWRRVKKMTKERRFNVAVV